MKTSVLVTGATGFLGEHLCAALVERGHIVRGLARTKSGVLDELGVELVRGDVLSGDELERALDGVSAVFHLAGAVSRDPDDAQRMMRLHVDGTRRVLDRMAAAGVRRMILASTSGTIGVSKREEILDESAPYAEEIVAGWPYYASKIYQERLAFEHGEKLGIEVVAVNPSLLLGPGDRRLSSTGDVRRFLKKQIPTIPDGGVSFVDARDAAAATAKALDKGRAGERYLLGGSNWSFADYFGRLERLTKVAAPLLKSPKGRLPFLASHVQAAIARSLGRTPRLEPAAVEMAGYFWYFDSSKAHDELGFVARDATETLFDTVAYLRKHVLGTRALADAEARAPAPG
jgi:dihydroflavonol-4-reductase